MSYDSRATRVPKAVKVLATSFNPSSPLSCTRRAYLKMQTTAIREMTARMKARPKDDKKDSTSKEGTE